MVKNPPATARVRRDMGLILGQEDSLEEGMTTHSSILAWRVPMDREVWQAIVQFSSVQVLSRVRLFAAP